MNDGALSWLPLAHPARWALAACLLAAALEGALAGRGVRQRFLEIRLPRPSPPLRVWSAVGLGYYGIAFALLVALLGRPPVAPWTPAALCLTALLLLVNAGWNWTFFRRKDLLLGFATFIAYDAIAAALGLVLTAIDLRLAGLVCLYLLYLVYANWWGYRLWRDNP